ncbi:MAG TPA: alpha/beta hydrolase [Polyangia bacterium]|jgi:pimeloyl-ACP methyl ester carboxylesterase
MLVGARQLTRAAGRVAATVVDRAESWVSARLGIDHALRLRPAVDGDRRELDTRAGRLSYYIDRRAGGRPLVLVHGVDAAASAYEVRPLFHHYRQLRTVLAPDLPGFGYSERGDRRYTPALYEDALIDLLEQELDADGPADLVALALGCELVARVALERPQLVSSLGLISPTGLDLPRPGYERWRRALTARVTAPAVYDLLVSRRSIRYSLSKAFAGPIHPGLADYAYVTSHQPGARFAPLAFLAGDLATPKVLDRVYARVRKPVLVIHGDDGFNGNERLPELLGQHRWIARHIAGTGAMPHFENPLETTQALDLFWEDVESREFELPDAEEDVPEA